MLNLGIKFVPIDLTDCFSQNSDKEASISTLMKYLLNDN